jgi:hypothetical protein
MDDGWVSAANSQQALAQKSYLLFYRLKRDTHREVQQAVAMEVEKPVGKALERQTAVSLDRRN